MEATQLARLRFAPLAAARFPFLLLTPGPAGAVTGRLVRGPGRPLGPEAAR